MGHHPTAVCDQTGEQHEEEVPGCCSCVWFFHTPLRLLSVKFKEIYIVKLPKCLISSDFNHPIHQTISSKSQQQKKKKKSLVLAEKIWQILHRPYPHPHPQLCCSSHTCMFMTNETPSKRETIRLSSGKRFIPKHCSKEIICQTPMSLLFVLSLYHILQFIF